MVVGLIAVGGRGVHFAVQAEVAVKLGSGVELGMVVNVADGVSVNSIVGGGLSVAIRGGGLDRWIKVGVTVS